MTSDSLNAKINLLEVIESFSPSEDIQNALLLTFNFDGLYLEDPERGLLESIWQRNCTNILVIRDSKAVIKHKQSQRYNVINASFSKRIFHSKLILLTETIAMKTKTHFLPVYHHYFFTICIKP
jgi:hypothetical protein